MMILRDYHLILLNSFLIVFDGLDFETIIFYVLKQTIAYDFTFN